MIPVLSACNSAGPIILQFLFPCCCESAHQPIPKGQGAGFIFLQSSCSAALFSSPIMQALSGTGGPDPKLALATSRAGFPISASPSLPATKLQSASPDFRLPDGTQ